MKKLIAVAAMALTLSSVNAQGWYSTTGSETIFSLPMFTDSGQGGGVLRFAPVFNVQFMMNNDFSQSAGVYTGLALRNVGFIADDPSIANRRRKFRTYNLGIPLGLKLGKMNGMLVYVGADFEYAFNYKEKVFESGSKTGKSVTWFGNQHRQFITAGHVGFQFDKGFNLKFKYYLQGFFNPDHPNYASEYERFQSNVFYISLNSNLFKGTKFTYSE